MTWRTVVINQRAKLSFKMGHMIVRMQDNEIKRIYLKDISHVILNTTEVSITAALMNEFQKNKIKFILCDEKRNPVSELVPYYNSYNTSEKIRSQIKWKDTVKAEVWKLIIKEKISNQKELLEKHNKENSGLLELYIKEVLDGDTTNREGHAAKVYFNSLFGMDFTRNDDSNTNRILNYGYSILLSAINRSVVAQGYITQLGIFHDNMFNQFNLSSDLIEPWRVLVDTEAYDYADEIFNNDVKIHLINTLNRTCMIDSKEQTINNAIDIYTKSVFDALNQMDTSLIRFPRYEL